MVGARLTQFGVRQDKLVGGVSPSRGKASSQPPGSRVTHEVLFARAAVKRSRGKHGPSIELRNGSNSEVPISFRNPGSRRAAHESGPPWPRQSCASPSREHCRTRPRSIYVALNNVKPSRSAKTSRSNWSSIERSPYSSIEYRALPAWYAQSSHCLLHSKPA